VPRNWIQREEGEAKALQKMQQALTLLTYVKMFTSQSKASVNPSFYAADVLKMFHYLSWI
jgi:negative regulator of sigma E activity